MLIEDASVHSLHFLAIMTFPDLGDGHWFWLVLEGGSTVWVLNLLPGFRERDVASSVGNFIEWVIINLLCGSEWCNSWPGFVLPIFSCLSKYKEVCLLDGIQVGDMEVRDGLCPKQPPSNTCGHVVAITVLRFVQDPEGFLLRAKVRRR